MSEVQMSKEEVFDMMQHLYPTETARCMAEVKANKLQEMLDEKEDD